MDNRSKTISLQAPQGPQHQAQNVADKREGHIHANELREVCDHSHHSHHSHHDTPALVIHMDVEGCESIERE